MVLEWTEMQADAIFFLFFTPDLERFVFETFSYILTLGYERC